MLFIMVCDVYFYVTGLIAERITVLKEIGTTWSDIVGEPKKYGVLLAESHNLKSTLGVLRTPDYYD